MLNGIRKASCSLLFFPFAEETMQPSFNYSFAIRSELRVRKCKTIVNIPVLDLIFSLTFVTKHHSNLTSIHQKVSGIEVFLSFELTSLMPTADSLIWTTMKIHIFKPEISSYLLHLESAEVFSHKWDIFCRQNIDPFLLSILQNIFLM